jgi:uncharacterized protein DUF998
VTPLLGVLAALMTLACAAALVRVHLLPTGYRPLSDAVSDYGVGPYSRYYRWQTAASAYAALLVAGALARTTHPVPQLPVFLLLVFAAARLVIPTFPTDLDRSEPTLAGRLHLVAAAVAFASIAWCAAVLPDRVHWPNLHGTLVVLGWIVVATAIACAVALRSPFFGLVERTFYAALLLWLLVVSLHFV